MGLFIYEDFLLDLKAHEGTNFARRVLSKVLDDAGNFMVDDDDHRYGGIDDAWIRVVSKGSTAYRSIYIRKGEDIYLYRAGEHSVEDGLVSPRAGAPIIKILPSKHETANAVYWADAAPAAQNRLLKNSSATYLRNKILGRRLIPHKEVMLISPFIAKELFYVTSSFGKMLFDLKEDGAKLSLITLPPTEDESLKFFVNLDAQGISVMFHETLHAKLYLFEPDTDRLRPHEKEKSEPLGILGSANLTKRGLGMPEPGNEELCYALAAQEYDHALEFAARLLIDAIDVQTYRIRFKQKKTKF